MWTGDLIGLSSLGAHPGTDPGTLLPPGAASQEPRCVDGQVQLGPPNTPYPVHTRVTGAHTHTAHPHLPPTHTHTHCTHVHTHTRSPHPAAGALRLQEAGPLAPTSPAAHSCQSYLSPPACGRGPVPVGAEEAGKAEGRQTKGPVGRDDRSRSPMDTEHPELLLARAGVQPGPGGKEGKGELGKGSQPGRAWGGRANLGGEKRGAWRGWGSRRGPGNTTNAQPRAHRALARLGGTSPPPQSCV